MSRVVAIVGGGVAGLAAALRVAESGDRPIVIETRGKLGGRATSFEDARTGLVLDNCQHVLMGCCTNLIDFYGRLGVDDLIEWHDTTFWANPPMDPDRMKPSWWPAPGHFTGSFLRMRQLDLRDKLAIARAMWRMIRIGRHGRAQWAGRDFGAFLGETGQTPAAIDRFWEPVVVSACNMPSASCDAALAMKVFQDGFLQDAWSPCMGISTVPLARLYDPAREAIVRAGGELRDSTSAIALNFDGRRITGVTTDEGIVECSAVITSVPPDRLAKLCSDTLRRADARLRDLEAVPFSPILGVHLFFDHPVMDTPHLVLPGRATQWLFRKAADNGREHVHAVISGADAWMALDEAEIVRRVLADMAWALPRVRGLDPVAVRAVKEKRATFACVPGIDRLRPKAVPDPIAGGVPNLFLAGDWTATGWPATMEGAVRSGYTAAAAWTGQGGVIADVPPGRLASLLGLRA